MKRVLTYPGSLEGFWVNEKKSLVVKRVHDQK